MLQKPAYEWRNSLFVGGLKDRRLVRLESEDGRVTGEKHASEKKYPELWRIVPRA